MSRARIKHNIEQCEKSIRDYALPLRQRERIEQYKDDCEASLALVQDCVSGLSGYNVQPINAEMNRALSAVQAVSSNANADWNNWLQTQQRDERAKDSLQGWKDDLKAREKQIKRLERAYNKGDISEIEAEYLLSEFQSQTSDVSESQQQHKQMLYAESLGQVREQYATWKTENEVESVIVILMGWGMQNEYRRAMVRSHCIFRAIDSINNQGVLNKVVDAAAGKFFSAHYYDRITGAAIGTQGSGSAILDPHNRKLHSASYNLGYVGIDY